MFQGNHSKQYTDQEWADAANMSLSDWRQWQKGAPPPAPSGLGNFGKPRTDSDMPTYHILNAHIKMDSGACGTITGYRHDPTKGPVATVDHHLADHSRSGVMKEIPFTQLRPFDSVEGGEVVKAMAAECLRFECRTIERAAEQAHDETRLTTLVPLVALVAK